MNAQELYQHFRVPPNMQRHMLRAAALGNVLLAHWRGPNVSDEEVVATLLIHDLGNIVKADYDSASPLLEEEQGNLAFWREVKAETIAKYGSDDHVATHLMAQECGISARILEILDRKIFNRNLETLETDDWAVKITAYADQRVGPFGILSLDDRFAELKTRYKGKPESSIYRPDAERLIQAAYELEAQVLHHTDLSPSDLDDEAIADQINELKRYELHGSQAPSG